MKIALISGITGQDGSYLADLLIEKGYQVHGIKRRSSQFNTSRIDHIYEGPDNLNRNLILHHGDMTDGMSLQNIISRIKPDEIYNLAAQSHVGISFDLPEYTADVNALGTLRILEAIKNLNLKKCKFYQASSSELYGKVMEKPQTEQTPFYPRSPYAISKLFAYWITINYREAYGLFACNGILFNHESPRRGENFVTRKITRSLTRIKYGLEDILELGNLNSKRDWGHAKDYVEMQWLMLQQKKPKDYVISTGINTTVRKFVELVSHKLGFTIKWSGKGLREKGKISSIKKTEKSQNLKEGKVIIKINPRYFRPAEVDDLLGSSKLAQRELSWKPRYNIKSMISEMVDSEIIEVNKEIILSKTATK